jgi:hypothetical protein
MKTTLAILVASLFSAAAWAGSPFLDISATNTWKSSERAAIEAAVTQAEAQGKFVLIDMAAAWCGPCLALDKEMEARKAEMEPVLQNYVYVKLEEMHLEQIYGVDFLGFEIAWFPSLFIVNPTTKQWTALGATQVDGLKQVLTDYKAQNGAGIGHLYVDRFMTELRAGRPADFNAILDGMISASTEFDAASYLAVLKELTGIMDSNPALFNAPVNDMRAYLAMANSRLIERGVATVADVRAADAQAFAGLEQDANSLQNINFGNALGVLIRTKGNVAAAEQCSALSATVGAQLSFATAEDQRTLTLVRDIQCLLLDVQTGRKTGADARQYLTTMSEQEQRGMSESLMKLFGSTGTDFDLAIKYGTIVKTAYENAFKKRPELLARVQKATDDRLAAYAANKSHP